MLQQLTLSQKKLIEQYVNELFFEKMKLIEEYYDVDKGLELKPEVIKRLSLNKKEKTISHDEFWKKVLFT
jgi:hypothetical protein